MKYSNYLFFLSRFLFAILLSFGFLVLFSAIPAHAVLLEGAAESTTATSDANSKGGELQKYIQQIEAIKLKLQALQADGTSMDAIKGGFSSSKPDGKGPQTQEMSPQRCSTIERPIRFGNQDRDHNGGVFALQRYLTTKPHLYPSGQVTGYFGPATQAAIQAFQKENGIVTSGSPETTGFGVVGPKTLTAINAQIGTKCGTVTSFTLSDVHTVVSRLVDPIKTAVDDEYTEYKIVLKRGGMVTVKMCGFCTQQMRDKAFRDAGYTGDIAALIKLAVKEQVQGCNNGKRVYKEGEAVTSLISESGAAPKPTPADAHFVCRSGKWKIEGTYPGPTLPTNVDFSLSTTASTATAAFSLTNGCEGYEVYWGDASTADRLSGSAGPICTMNVRNINLSHAYTKAGTYTVTLKILSGSSVKKVGTKTITIGG
jgi:peptidoglycan hydrolase-like protein with peptidoglycan-binding domain